MSTKIGIIIVAVIVIFIGALSLIFFQLNKETSVNSQTKSSQTGNTNLNETVSNGTVMPSINPTKYFQTRQQYVNP